MMEQASNYDHWAWLYNQTLGPRYGDHKIGPIERVVLPHVPASGTILDLCCGTGQLVAQLAARGYRVTGFDGSADMLRFARENAPASDFIQGDARDFAFETPFDAVICTSASLNHMQGFQDLSGVFRSVNRSLKTGGVFVFDVNHPAQMSRHWHGRPTEGEIHPDFAWLITPKYDPAAGRGAFKVDIYRRPERRRGFALKSLVGRLVRSDALRRWRLALLSRYAAFRPDWEHRSVVNVVWGHDLDAVTALLKACGFDPELRSTKGGPIDEKNAAYFFCRKVAGIDSCAVETALEVSR